MKNGRRVGDGAWPVLDEPRDPWAEPWPDDDLGYSDLCGLAGARPQPEATYRTAALALQDYASALHAGDPLDVPRLRDLAAAAQVRTGEDRVDRRPLIVGDRRADEIELVRITTDFAPAAGLFGTDAFLGPWSEALPHDDPRTRRTLAWSLAHWGAGRPTSHPPVHTWRKAKVSPPREDRAAVRAVVRAPMGIWRVQAEGSRWRLHDLAGIAPHRHPDVALDLDHHAGVGSLHDGATVLCRVVSTRQGWTAWAPIVLPRPADPLAVRAWVQVELTIKRLRDRRATIEDVLRDQAHRVARLAHLAMWG